MKTLFRVLLVCLFIGVVSCRDTKKEEAETQAVVEQIEVIEDQADEISEDIQNQADELQKELEELENIE